MSDGLIKLKVTYGYDEAWADRNEAFFWPTSDQKRREVTAVRRNSPADFEAIYQQRPGAREGSIFLKKDFLYYVPPEALWYGINAPSVAKFCEHGHGIFQAWDTAFSETAGSAWSVCVTGLLLPCSKYHCGEDEKINGPCDAHFDVLILDVFRKKMDWGSLPLAVRQQHMKWRPELVLVENRASGISILQSMPGANINIQGVEAKEGKRARAISGTEAGSVQGWCRQHRVLFPQTARWLKTFETELKDFSGIDDAVSDQVDAFVHLVTYAIQLGAKTMLLPSDWSPDTAPPDLIEASKAVNHGIADPRLEALMFIDELPSMVVDPYATSCSNCTHYEKGWCGLWRRPMIPMDCCEHVELVDRPVSDGGGYVRRSDTRTI
jgi:predicted phage terminase large subunit-like protein